MPYKIFIDQGHNPMNPNAGAEYGGVREQDITFTVGRRLYALLSADPRFTAELSRPEPTTQLGTTNRESLQARVLAAKRFGADFFISLHANAAADAAVSGSEAFVYSRESRANCLAFRILTGLHEETGLKNRGVFVRPGLYVLRNTAMPAVLVELGFLSNEHDRRLMVEEPSAFALGVYDGLLSYYGLPPVTSPFGGTAST